MPLAGTVRISVCETFIVLPTLGERSYPLSDLACKHLMPADRCSLV